MPDAPNRTSRSQDRFDQLRDFILEYHGAQPADGARVIGRTPEGLAVALICEDPPTQRQRDVLTQDKLHQLLEEARELGLGTPAAVWAAGCVAPREDRLYRLHHLAMWPPPLPELLLVKMYITPEHYERLRHLDHDLRASLITFTHHSQEMIEENDLRQALADAQAAANRSGPPPELPQHTPPETLLRLLHYAAARWMPLTATSSSRWNGSRQQALEFLATAASANPGTPSPT